MPDSWHSSYPVPIGNTQPSHGWTFIVLTLFAMLPEFFREYNFMYPLIAALSVPFLAITIKYLLAGDERAINLSRAAAVAFLIYAPFGFTQLPLFAWLSNQLISLVVDQILWILGALNFTVSLTCMNPVTQQVLDPAACGSLLRDTITRNGYSVQIILGCTGIQSIAIMLGVAAAVPTTLRQKMLCVPPHRADDLFPQPAQERLCHHGVHRAVVPLLPGYRR